MLPPFVSCCFPYYVAFCFGGGLLFTAKEGDAHPRLLVIQGGNVRQLCRSDLTKRKIPKSVVYRRKEKLSWKLFLKKTWHAIHHLVALYILYLHTKFQPSRSKDKKVYYQPTRYSPFRKTKVSLAGKRLTHQKGSNVEITYVTHFFGYL